MFLQLLVREIRVVPQATSNILMAMLTWTKRAEMSTAFESRYAVVHVMVIPSPILEVTQHDLACLNDTILEEANLKYGMKQLSVRNGKLIELRKFIKSWPGKFLLDLWVHRTCNFEVRFDQSIYAFVAGYDALMVH